MFALIPSSIFHTFTFFQVNVTQTRLAPTELRLDDNYVLWYSNVARLVVTGIVPFAALTYLNSR